MSMNLVTLLYLVASVCFIQALKGLSHPTTSIRGNLFGMVGMGLAVVTTAALIFQLAGQMGQNAGQGMAWVLGGLVIGGAAGTLMAKRVEMTKMPELVAFMHSMIGLAAVFIAVAVVAEPWAFGITTKGVPIPFGNMLPSFAIAAFAIDCHLAFIYIRGEFALEAIILENALAEARAAGHLGKNIYGTGYELDMMVYRGAGAYIAGEETGMLESLEGKRAHPRIKPPFPAVVGLYGSPTVINNVETLANVPAIIENGAAWFAAIGTPKSTGTKLMNISGHVNRPGVVELPMGTKLMTIINDYCGGVWHNRKLKAVIPGGSSVPVLTAAECEEVTVDYDSLAAAGTMLGTAAIIVMDETTCMVQVLSLIHI